jgi:serine/threonine protein kinase/tetratricopeptide (TPR) repeat protein
MPPERWRQIEQLYLAAVDLREEERAALLAQASPDVRRKVEGMLAQPAGSKLLDRPAWEAVPKSSASIAIGTQLGAYRIESVLGQGGMGVVYRALDTKLNRTVAVKILSDDLADAASRRRFQREAQTASSLNHPHILTVHDAGEVDGRQYLVTEFVDGGTLRDWARAEKRGWAQIVELLVGVADGLAAAHEAGILHRDIKSANILVAKNGYAKLADFGLAKLVSGSEGEITRAPTEQAAGPGFAIGTVAYMSPEQAAGEPLDARSDIFSFGVVLYEMSTGALPFRGDSPGIIFDSILNHAPVPAVRLNPDLPAELERIIDRCLEKDRNLRYQRASEIRTDLQRLKRDTGSGRAAAVIDAPKRWKVIVPVAAAVVLAIVAAGYLYFHRNPKLTDKDTIVLADFSNTTGDPVFDGTLRQGLSVQVEQSPFLSRVSDERIQKTLGLMQQPADARLTPQIAKEICERTASAAVLDGSIASLGTQYVLGLRATNCRSGEVLDEEQAQAARKEEVLNSLSQIASRLRTRLGESLATVEKHDTPLAEATTSSLEALKAYSAFFTPGSAGLSLLKRAVEIDPNFAMAQALLGSFYALDGESGLAAQSITKAYQLRDHVSDHERFFITASYDGTVTGNLERLQQTGELWEQMYPRDSFVRGGTLPVAYAGLGKYERVVEEGERAIELDPDSGQPSYFNLAFGYICLGRVKEAERTIQRAAERKVDIGSLRYNLAFLKGDQAEMERIAALRRQTPGEEKSDIFSQEASVLAYAGHLRQARTMSQHAVQLAQQAAQQENAASDEVSAALPEALFENPSEARHAATVALALSKALEVEYGAALALALSGDSSRPQTLANDLETRRPEATPVRFSYLPTLRALLALQRGEPAKAIELLQPAAPFELGLPWTGGSVCGALYPVYVRGEAYLAAHQGPEAAAEFQKILDHRGIVGSDPIGALARLQLGRAYALSGDKTKAKTAYQDFLTLWKDADPDIPILKEAKAEYAKL